MVKLTAVLAALFFVTSFSLAMYAKQRAEVGAQSGVPMVEEQSEAQEQASGDAAQDAGGKDSEDGDEQSSESDAQKDGEELPRSNKPA